MYRQLPQGSGLAMVALFVRKTWPAREEGEGGGGGGEHGKERAAWGSR